MRNRIADVSMAFLFFPMAALAQLSIAPTTQSVLNPGSSALYVVTLTNPTGSTQTFIPSATGNNFSLVPWGVQLPASVPCAKR